MQLRATKVAILLLLAEMGFGTALSRSQSAPAAKDAEFDTHFQHGQQFLKTGKYQEAINELKRAAKLHENSCSACYYAMALAYIKSGQFAEAAKTCDAAMAVAADDPGRAAAHNLKGSALLALSRTDSKKLATAESELRTAIQLDGKMALYHFGLATMLLRESKDAEAKGELQSCLALNPDRETAEQARLFLADPRRGREEFAPDFELTTQQGQVISLRQLSGRIVVMDFWATWCPPCRESVPELKDLSRKYPSEKLMLVSVSADNDEQAWRNFVAKRNMDWAQYRDADHRVLEAFHVRSFPTYLVIDGEGIVKQRIVGLNPRETVVHRLKATLEHMPQLEGEIGRK